MGVKEQRFSCCFVLPKAGSQVLEIGVQVVGLAISGLTNPLLLPTSCFRFLPLQWAEYFAFFLCKVVCTYQPLHERLVPTALDACQRMTGQMPSE